MPSEIGAEAIREIERLTRAAAKTEILDAPLETKGTYYLVGPGGTATREVAAAGWHREQLDTPAELKRFAERHSDKSSAVYLADDRLVFVYDQDDRRDVADCILVKSPQFDFLEAVGGKPMSQRDFIRALRIDLRGALPAGSVLLDLVRNLKFSNGATGEADLQHGRQSISRSVVAAVMGVDAIPEEIGLRVPVFENHPFHADVACAIEMLPQDEKFRLTPFPLQLRRAMDEALASIVDLLSSSDDAEKAMPPVYRGRP